MSAVNAPRVENADLHCAKSAIFWMRTPAALKSAHVRGCQVAGPTLLCALT